MTKRKETAALKVYDEAMAAARKAYNETMEVKP